MVNQEAVPGRRRVLGDGRDLAVLEDKAHVVGAVLLKGDGPLKGSARQTPTPNRNYEINPLNLP